MEKLHKVRSFSELRIGQIIVKKKCDICSKDHRYLLIDFDDANGWFDVDTGLAGEEPAFGAIPVCSAGGPTADSDAVIPSDVDHGRIFLVEDGLGLDKRELVFVKAGS